MAEALMIIQKDVRVVQRQRLVLIRVHLEAGPTFLMAVCSPGSQKVFIWVARAPCVIAQDDACFGIGDELTVLVVHKDELCPAVRQDVFHLVLPQPGVDRRHDRARADDTL